MDDFIPQKSVSIRKFIRSKFFNQAYAIRCAPRKHSTNSKSIKKLIDPNGTVINTPSKIAENFNNFFANIAGNLKEENNRNLTGSHDHNQFLKNTVSNSIYLNQVTSDEIYNIIKKTSKTNLRWISESAR